MKKGSVYFLPPIILLVAFSALYWNFHKGYDLRMAKIAEAKEAARVKKIADQVAATDAAYQKALKDIDAATAKRAADEAKKQKEAEEFEAALQGRLKAQNESHDATTAAGRLKADVDAIEKDIQELAIAKKAAEAEQVHMRELVKQAQANVAATNDELKKIQDVGEAWSKKINELQRLAKQQQK